MSWTLSDRTFWNRAWYFSAAIIYSCMYQTFHSQCTCHSLETCTVTYIWQFSVAICRNSTRWTVCVFAATDCQIMHSGCNRSTLSHLVTLTYIFYAPMTIIIQFRAFPFLKINKYVWFKPYVPCVTFTPPPSPTRQVFWRNSFWFICRKKNFKLTPKFTRNPHKHARKRYREGREIPCFKSKPNLAWVWGYRRSRWRHGDFASRIHKI